MIKEFKLLTPSPPNFATIQGTKSKVPISDFTEKEALAYAASMASEFMKHWKNSKQLEGEKLQSFAPSKPPAEDPTNAKPKRK